MTLLFENYNAPAKAGAAFTNITLSEPLSIVNPQQVNSLSVDQNAPVGNLVASNGAVHIENTGNTGIGLGVYSDMNFASEAPLSHIKVNNPSFGHDALKVENLGSAETLTLVHTDTGTANTVSLTRVGSNAVDITGLTISVANGGAGNENAFRFNGNEIVNTDVGAIKDKKIRVSVAGTEYFIPLYTT